MREFPPTSTTAQEKTHCHHKNIQFHIHVFRLCFHVIITKFYKWVFKLSFDHAFLEWNILEIFFLICSFHPCIKLNLSHIHRIMNKWHKCLMSRLQHEVVVLVVYFFPSFLLRKCNKFFFFPVIIDVNCCYCFLHTRPMKVNFLIALLLVASFIHFFF